ncbi:MAG TPA: DUF92 domain-containing protein [Gemmatimonadaceae bacterium]|nr:DUF92 domain-containing protein [Gemmatimonadaceae bacterium]
MPSILDTAAGRLAAGLLLATLVALLARRARVLAPTGALAAVATGALAVGAGWAWGVLLVVFFAASTLVSRPGAAIRAARTAQVVAKGGERDGAQVLANGGVFALAALGAMLAPHPAWGAVALGALAAAISDTWATEIGTLARGQPRSILTGRAVPHGTSGGVSVQGTLASLAGAAGGVAGATADSLLGATLQARRWCDRCEMATERNVHGCGEDTRLAGGIGWLDNDAVNAAATAVGAVVAMVVVVAVHA